MQALAACVDLKPFELKNSYMYVLFLSWLSQLGDTGTGDVLEV